MQTETNLMNGYEDALKMACAELATRDSAQICLHAAVSYNEILNTYSVVYLNKPYQINASTGEVSYDDSSSMCKQLIQSTVKVLLLHYLLNAGNRPLSGKLISFRELKNGGAVYYPTFYKRAVAPLIKTFGDCIEDLHRVSKELNGIQEKYGHSSVTIQVLPMVPVTFILWEGEEDVSPSGTVLFDSSVEDFLPAEDIVFAGSFGVYELIRLKNECKATLKA